MTERESYRDPQRDIAERVEDLLGRMTLEEKLRQMGCIWSTELAENDEFDEQAAAARLYDGIGHVTRIGASTGLTPEANARFANRIQRVLVEQSRLGIPAVIHEEAVAGFCARGATQFPQAIGLAATFAPDLIQRMSDVIRQQMLAVGARHALSPVLDIARDPRWGRLEETYGEDPYLVGRMGVAYVRGLQGASLTEGVIATAKHFLGYGLTEGGMNHAPTHLGPRQLREVFAEPFAAAIRDAQLASVMNSYSSVDGLPCGASESLLDGLLREELGFEGLVVADYFTLDLLIRHHRVAADKAEAAAKALRAGMDVELPALDCFGEPLRMLIERGDVEVALVDRAVGRMLTAKFKLGLFENPFVDEERVSAFFETPEQRKLAREIAERSIVMLENDGVLPLTPGARPSIALIGPAGDDPRLLQGDYSYPAHAEIVYKREQLATRIAPAGGAAFQPGAYFVDMVTPRAGLEAFTDVRYEAGFDIDTTGANPDAAVAAAQNADIAVICVGGKSGLLPDCTSGEFRDTADLNLPQDQVALVKRLAQTGTPLVVIVIGGRAFALSDIVEHANALLYAWLPGEASGTALARILFGEVSPSARLPVSLPRHSGQVPVYYNHKSGGGRSAPMGDYVDMSSKPLYRFGYGLSYCQFDYDDFDCPDVVDVHGTLPIAVSVNNASALSAEEVVQLYVRDKVADVARPVQQLVGFMRVEVPSGYRRRVRFQLDMSQLAYYDQAMEFVVDPGEIDIMIGASSKDIRFEKTVRVSGEQRAVKQRQVIATQVIVE